MDEDEEERDDEEEDEEDKDEVTCRPPAAGRTCRRCFCFRSPAARRRGRWSRAKRTWSDVVFVFVFVLSDLPVPATRYRRVLVLAIHHGGLVAPGGDLGGAGHALSAAEVDVGAGDLLRPTLSSASVIIVIMKAASRCSPRAPRPACS
jgi:hypothetical protein